MNPFAIGCGGDMKTADIGFKDYVRRQAKRGIKVTIIREGESIIVRRQVPEARRRAAVAAILRDMDKNRGSKGPTASEIVREMRESGRY